MKKKCIFLLCLWLIAIVLSSYNFSTIAKVKPVKDKIEIQALMPDNINMKYDYNKLIKLYGNPIKIEKINDKRLILTKGYFVCLYYSDKKIILNCYDNKKPYNLKKNNVIAQIDYFGKDTKINKKIKIGDTYDYIYNNFRTDILKSDDIVSIKRILNQFKNDKAYSKYKKILGITTLYPNKLPISTVLLFNKNDKLYRICFIYLTAD